MTVCFPPLIKPDGRFSRIRLSGFLCRRATARRYRVICSCRTLSGAVSPRGPSPHPSLRLSPAEQVASLRSPMFCPGHQRSGMGSSLLRTPPTSVMARAAFPVSGVAPPVESSLPAMTDLPRWGKLARLSPLRSGSPLTRASLRDMSPTEEAEGNREAGRRASKTPPVHCRNPRRLIRVPTLRPSPKSEGLGCRELSFEAHLCGSSVHCDLPVRLHACSPPRLAATQLARSAVRNRLIAPTGLSPALTPASRALQKLTPDANGAQLVRKTSALRPP